MFAALALPAAVHEELRARTDAVYADLPDAERLRWSDPAGWHCTLAFYGPVAADRVPELCRRLARVAARREPFTLRLEGGGRFGDRVLWAGFEGDLEALGNLAGGARAAGRKAGAPADESLPFRPHVTLARGKAGVPLAPYVEGLRELRGQPWQVGELVLLRSHLPRPGVVGAQPRYERWDAWPLAG